MMRSAYTGVDEITGRKMPVIKLMKDIMEIHDDELIKAWDEDGKAEDEVAWGAAIYIRRRQEYRNEGM